MGYYFGQLRNDFTDGYELTDFVGYEMARLRKDWIPFVGNTFMLYNWLFSIIRQNLAMIIQSINRVVVCPKGNLTELIAYCKIM